VAIDQEREYSCSLEWNVFTHVAEEFWSSPRVNREGNSSILHGMNIDTVECFVLLKEARQDNQLREFVLTFRNRSID
jgi:hypothetical protein